MSFNAYNTYVVNGLLPCYLEGRALAPPRLAAAASAVLIILHIEFDQVNVRLKERKDTQTFLMKDIDE